MWDWLTTDVVIKGHMFDVIIAHVLTFIVGVFCGIIGTLCLKYEKELKEKKEGKCLY